MTRTGVRTLSPLLTWLLMLLTALAAAGQDSHYIAVIPATDRDVLSAETLT